MSDVSDQNGAANPEPQGQPSFGVVAQYVKDLSFENPDAPNSLRVRDKPPAINITINVHVNPMGATDYEVELKLEADAREDGGRTMFGVELVYAGIFRIANVPREQVQPLLMVECPRLLFPFARRIVAEMTRDGGFPPLMVDPVDFAALYRQRLAQAQAAQQAPAQPS